ncbi:unnamed protein product, partial [Polarella glacialis]
DALRGPSLPHGRISEDPQELPLGSLRQIALAAAAAGALHGAVCAPLDAAAHRLQALGPGNRAGLWASLWDAVRRPLPGSSPGAAPGLITGKLLPLTMARDSVGITSFFFTFEVLQMCLQDLASRQIAARKSASRDNTVPIQFLERTLATLAAG